MHANAYTYQLQNFLFIVFLVFFTLRPLRLHLLPLYLLVLSVYFCVQ